MAQNENNMKDINSEIVSTEKKIKEADAIIKNLKEKKLKKENPALIKDENDIIEIAHQTNTVDIKLYKEKILKLTKEIDKNKEKLLRLREENAKLKKDKNININKEESKEIKNKILNLKDLYQSIGLKIRKEAKEDNDNDNEALSNEENIKMGNIEIINKKIKEYENIFEELKEKANKINIIIINQNEKIKENWKYLNEVQNYVAEFRERLNISINNKLLENDSNTLKLKDYNALYENVSNILFELDNIILENKDKYEQNIEYNLLNIQNNIIHLNSEENKTESNFKDKCTKIEQIIDEIKSIFGVFDKTKNIFNDKNKRMDEEMEKLKNMCNGIINKFKKKEVDNKNKNNNNIKKDEDSIKRKKKLLGNSLLYKAKNQSKKLDIFKTINIFQNKDELNEDLEESKLFKKNYHEICYIYDDYDIHDVYYTLKAIVLPNNSKFSLATFYFNGYNKIEIREFDLDDIPSEYMQENNSAISFKIELSNMESIKVHIKYKEIRDLTEINDQGIKQNKIYRSDYYGLDNSLSGANAKYSLILKGNYVIVNFDEYFFIRNTNNDIDIEYMWGGIVPPEGKKAKITFSKKEVTWNFERIIKFHSNNYIKRTKFYIPIEFVGGNNEIINITPSSQEASDIILDEKKGQYIIKYANTKYKKAEIVIKGEFKNICKGGWNIDLTDKEIEKLMPEEDIKDKDQLKKIAKEIINEFDQSNKNDDFEYLDYMKIGIWVKKNIKYNYGYIGKKNSALKIYKMKAGVHHHYTRLANALLYSIGYKVISASGYFCKNANKFDQYNLHSFSLIKLEDDKWHPFDTALGVFIGKLHTGYVFRMLDNKDLIFDNNKNIILDKNEIHGKVIK